MRLLHNDVMFVLLAMNTVKPDAIFVLQGRFTWALKSSLFTLATKVALKIAYVCKQDKSHQDPTRGGWGKGAELPFKVKRCSL